MHFDGKILPDLIGSDKHDRLPIVATQSGGNQLLGVPQLEHGTGKATADAVYKVLDEWRLVDKIEAVCTDTTSVNTGDKNGAVFLLEEKLKKTLLYLPCRHHIYELILRDIFMTKLLKPQVQMFQFSMILKRYGTQLIKILINLG